jgi:hypothetical protein
MKSDHRGLTVVVTVDLAPDADATVMDDLVAHAENGLSRFAQWEGFVGGKLHRSRDGTRLIQYLQWRDEAAYRLCMDDPIWDAVPTTAGFFHHLKTGAARIDERFFDVVMTAPTKKP